MASWYDLPTELKLLILNAHILLSLNKLNKAEHDPDTSREHLILASIHQLLNLATALPLQRKEIISLCYNYEATCWRGLQITPKPYKPGQFVPLSLATIALIDLKRRWTSQSWLQFREEMRSPKERAVEGHGWMWEGTFHIHRCGHTSMLKRGPLRTTVLPFYKRG